VAYSATLLRLKVTCLDNDLVVDLYPVSELQKSLSLAAKGVVSCDTP